MTRGRALLRDAFDLDPDVAFLNNGSFGATPRGVSQAADAVRAAFERNPVAFMEEELPPRLDRAADRVAALVGAEPGRVALVDNATTGVAVALGAVELHPGDEVVTTGHVYPAVRHALRHAASRAGAAVVVADVPFPLDRPQAVVDAVDAAIGPRTRLVVVDHITSATGLVFPIHALVALCRSRGVPVIVDGAHAPVQVPLDLDGLGADFYTGNLHKWAFAPKGAAFVYARSPDGVHAHVISHGYAQGLRQELHWCGTRDPGPWCGIEAGLDFVDALGGADAVRAYNDALCAEAAAFLADDLGLALPSPAGMRAALCTLPHPGSRAGTLSEARDLHVALRARGVEIPVFPFAGRCWMRISAQVFNELDDYRRLAAALR